MSVARQQEDRRGYRQRHGKYKEKKLHASKSIQRSKAGVVRKERRGRDKEYF